MTWTRLLVGLAFGLAILSGPAWAQEQDERIAQAAAVRDAYWRVLDARDFTAGYAMRTPGTQQLLSPDQFAAGEQERYTLAGAAVERRVMRTQVYDNPAGALPGFYVAFDCTARFALADRLCGYLILHQATPGGPFLVMRDEQAFMPNSVVTSWSGRGVAPIDGWRQMATQRCPGWQPSWDLVPPP